MYISRLRGGDFWHIFFKFGSNIPFWKSLDKLVVKNNQLTFTPYLKGRVFAQYFVFGVLGVIFEIIPLFLPLYCRHSFYENVKPICNKFYSSLGFIIKMSFGWLQYVVLWRFYTTCFIIMYNIYDNNIQNLVWLLIKFYNWRN